MMLRDRRRKVLGVPVGRRRRRSMPAAGWAGAGLAAAASVPLAQRAGRAASRGRDVVAHGREMAGQAEKAVGTARQFQDAVSSHSTTIGKFGAVVNQARKLGKSGGGEGKPRLAHLIEEHTDIAVPRSVAYNQWTQLEMFPAIVKGIEAVEQQEDDKAQWTSKIGPIHRQWPARITEQVPDERIAWRSEGGPAHQGAVSFHSLDDQLTRVLVQIQYKPSGPLETVGNTLRIQRRRVRRDLRLFKHFLEMEGEATGEWRGRIGDADGDGSGADSSGLRAGNRQQHRRDASGGDEESSEGHKEPSSSSAQASRSPASANGRGRRTASPDSESASRPGGRRSSASATGSRSSSNGSRSSSASGRGAGARQSAGGRKGGRA